jgi:branched-chain amino acid aminotransferase
MVRRATLSDTLFSINGNIVPESQALIPATDRGFLYGDGLFETIHAYGRKLFRLDQHLDRLARGAELLAMQPRPDLKKLDSFAQELVDAAKFPEANVRLTYTRGSGPRGPSTHGKFTPLIAIMATRYNRQPEAPNSGAAAIIAGVRRQESAVTANLKTLNYIEQVLARREADDAGADEALLLNNAGLLCEGSASNISIVRGGGIAIPDPLRAGALPGIAQLTALEAAANLGIAVTQTSLGPWDASQADEAFLSGSMREITPLLRIGENIIGSGKPGPVTRKLLAEYRRIVERECSPFRYPR